MQTPVVAVVLALDGVIVEYIKRPRHLFQQFGASALREIDWSWLSLDGAICGIITWRIIGLMR